MTTLYHIDVSPWSEKARWALDLNGIDYRKVSYNPLTTPLVMRLKTGNFFENVTLPVLVDGKARIMDSFDIAQWASENGKMKSLFPENEFVAIVQWNRLSEEGLSAGRALALSRLAQNRKAKFEQLPFDVPAPLQPLFMPLIENRLKAFGNRYKFSFNHPQRYRADLDDVLEGLSRVLNDKGNYVLGEFTFADIAMAQVLQFVSPVSNRYIAVPEGLKACMQDPELAEKYSDLIAWRDNLYQKHRRAE